MGGFVLEALGPGKLVTSAPLKLIDLDACELEKSWHADHARAFWVQRQGSKQLRVVQSPQRLLLIEGQVDRYPAMEETLDAWLPGRWGSFRGFEIRTQPLPLTTIFVDSLGTRPVFYGNAEWGFVASDKLSSLALNLPGRLEANWAAILEAATLGALYSTDTTLRTAIQLKPGEVVEFAAGRALIRYCYEPRRDTTLTAEAVHADPPGSLLTALRIAVGETWTDSESWLLLSGGLDSRLSLALAGAGRKALTVTTRENRESHVARQIAAACGAEFRHWEVAADHYHDILRASYLLTGSAADPQQAHHLGLATRWRANGICGVANAYLFDALLKGSRLYPFQKHVNPRLGLHAIMGNRTILFSGKRSGRHFEFTSEVIAATLTSEGQHLLTQRLKNLVAGIEPVVVDGFDTTAEELVVRSITKSVDYPIGLAWMEGEDIQTPSFHPAILSWHRCSRPDDRYKEETLCKAILTRGHPVADIFNANTGRLPALPSWAWRDELGRQPWYPLARSLWSLNGSKGAKRLTAKSDPDEGSWPPLAPVFRIAAGLEVLEEGLRHLDDASIFNSRAIDQLLQSYRSGDGRLVEALMVLSAVGRWFHFLRAPDMLLDKGLIRSRPGMK